MSLTHAANAKFRARRKLKDRIFTILCFGATAIAVFLLILLLYKIIADGATRLNWRFLGDMPSSFNGKTAGIKSALIGSFLVMALTAATAVPIGVAAAIYLEEFTRRKSWLTNFIQVNISNLAGVPSIVYGLLGLALFVRWFMLGSTILAGALTMSLLILPMVIIVSQEALKSVPNSFREGSYALGATQWQTIRRQVLPSAAPGILTGIILSLSRAIGETAPLIVVGAFGFVNFLPKNISSNYTVLPVQIFGWSSRPEKDFQVAAAAGIIVLIVVLLTLNGMAIALRAKAKAKL